MEIVGHTPSPMSTSATSSLNTSEVLEPTPKIYLNVEDKLPAPDRMPPLVSPDIKQTPERLSKLGVTQEDMDNSHDVSIYGVAGHRRFYLDGYKMCPSLTCKKCYGCKHLSEGGKIEMRMFMRDMEEDFWNDEDTDPEDDEEVDPTYQPERKRRKIDHVPDEYQE